MARESTADTSAVPTARDEPVYVGREPSRIVWVTGFTRVAALIEVVNIPVMQGRQEVTSQWLPQQSGSGYP